MLGTRMAAIDRGCPANGGLFVRYLLIFFLDFLAGERSLSHRPDERGPSNGAPDQLRSRLRY